MQAYSQTIGPIVTGSKVSELETERCALLAQDWEMGIKKQAISSITTQRSSGIDYGLAGVVGWHNLCDLLEHRRMTFGYTGWGCNGGKHLCTRSGTGRTGPRNEPAWICHSQPLTPVVCQRDTWWRWWRLPISIQVTHFHDSPPPICWGSTGRLTCCEWEALVWDHWGLVSEWHSSPPRQLQSLDLSPPQWHLRTTMNPLVGWCGLRHKRHCSWRYGTKSWKLWLCHRSLRYHHSTCEGNMVC